ncbi:MAG: phage tail tape measure protein [Tissierellia bacterium]|nr:phage tail tape measure protein [Tissierellia bacterium]
MANDLIKILLQAEVSNDSIESIKKQINNVQTNIKPIKISVDAKGSIGVKELTDAFEKLEHVTKKNLLLDLDRMSNRYKNLVKPEDVSNIRSMINSLSHTDPKLGHNIDLIKVKMKEVSVGAEQSKKALDLANKSAMSFGEAMKTAAYKFGIWSAITASYYKVIREIATGVRFITEMDTALTEIGIVQNKNREQVAGLAKEYNTLAKEMKVLTSDITSGAVEFYRQGLSQEEVMKRLQTTTMYSKIANLDFKQSAELLTATVNSMGVSIERAADVFTYLGDATATGADEIGIGFSKTGGAAAALGLEFEKVASWIKCSPSM